MDESSELTRSDITEAMKLFATIFGPPRHMKDLSELTKLVDAWCLVFVEPREYGRKIFAGAVRNALSECEYFPTPARVAAICDTLKNARPGPWQNLKGGDEA